MKSPLHILHLEDDSDDAALIASTLKSGGISTATTCVQTRADFVAALEQGGIDLILSDFSLPAFDGLSEAERQVYEALPGRGAATIDQIAVGSGLVPARVLGPLAMLEVAGLAERHEGRWRIVRARAGRAGATARLV